MRTFYLHLIENGPGNFFGWLTFILLWPISMIYMLVIWIRSQAYQIGFFKSYQASVPVVSIGNITVGGTGKTPFVDFVVRYLSRQGKKIAIVSRGYGGSFTGDCARVDIGDSTSQMSAADVGDEPFLLAARNPTALVYVARKRFLGVAAAEQAGADFIVLDDGFQHLGVARDLDIVLLDKRSPFGNGSLLPAGILREPPNALTRAHLVVWTHAEDDREAPAIKVDSTSCRHSFSDYLVDLEGNRHHWEEIEGRACLAFAGIAHPSDFFAKLRCTGCNLEKTIPLDDHQKYDQHTIQTILHHANNLEYLLTTEKDAVKLRGLNLPLPCFAVPLTLEFNDITVVETALNSIMGGLDD